MTSKSSPKTRAVQRLRQILSPKISQQQLAKELGVTQQAVSAWVNGHAKPDLEKMLDLEKRFGISPREWTELPELGGAPAAAFPAAGSPAPQVQESR